MNCERVGSILEHQRGASLTPAERANVDAHLATCKRCAGVWFAHLTLTSERVVARRPGLLDDIVRGIRYEPGRAVPARPSGVARSVAAYGLAAAALIAAVSLWSLRHPPAGDTAAPASGPAAQAAPAVPTEPAVPAARGDREPYRDVEQMVARRERRDGTVVVEEFFTYGCDQCSTLETKLDEWAAARTGVVLARFPAVLDERARLHAQAFYTAEVLGKLDAMHAAFYDEIHRVGNPLGSAAALEAFFERFGVDSATFGAAFFSPEVYIRVDRAEKLSRSAYRIDFTPSLVVGGAYVTSPQLAGSMAALFPVVDELVAKVTDPAERAKRAARGGRPIGGPMQ